MRKLLLILLLVLAACTATSGPRDFDTCEALFDGKNITGTAVIEGEGHQGTGGSMQLSGWLLYSFTYQGCEFFFTAGTKYKDFRSECDERPLEPGKSHCIVKNYDVNIGDTIEFEGIVKSSCTYSLAVGCTPSIPDGEKYLSLSMRSDYGHIRKI